MTTDLCWTRRAVQAHMNLIESLAPFAILVIVVHTSGKANEVTALGSTIFFCVRIAHLIVYLRTLAWFASWADGILILIQLFK